MAKRWQHIILRECRRTKDDTITDGLYRIIMDETVGFTTLLPFFPLIIIFSTMVSTLIGLILMHQQAPNLYEGWVVDPSGLYRWIIFGLIAGLIISVILRLATLNLSYDDFFRFNLHNRPDTISEPFDIDLLIHQIIGIIWRMFVLFLVLGILSMPITCLTTGSVSENNTLVPSLVIAINILGNVVITLMIIIFYLLNQRIWGLAAIFMGPTLVIITMIGSVIFQNHSFDYNLLYTCVGGLIILLVLYRKLEYLPVRFYLIIIYGLMSTANFGLYKLENADSEAGALISGGDAWFPPYGLIIWFSSSLLAMLIYLLMVNKFPENNIDEDGIIDSLHNLPLPGRRPSPSLLLKAFERSGHWIFSEIQDAIKSIDDNSPIDKFRTLLKAQDYESRLVGRYALINAEGKSVPPLVRIQDKYDIPLTDSSHIIAAEISKKTKRHAGKGSRLICPHCLTKYARQLFQIGNKKYSFYGCRSCQGSSKYIENKYLSAILDRNMDSNQSESENKIRVNYLKRDALFDFERVEIIEASDYEVERFCMMVGNDGDQWRRKRYKNMECILHESCGLSRKVTKILQDLFGKVIIKN